MKKLLAIILVMAMAGGCISAQSSAGGEMAGKAESKTGINSNQDTATSNTATVEMRESTITVYDKDGKIVSVIKIGGGKAGTGSESQQNSNADAQAKSIAEIKAEVEAQSKSAVNMTWLLIAIAVMVFLASVVTRLWEKYTKPAKALAKISKDVINM